MSANILFVIPSLEVMGAAMQLGLLARSLLKTEYRPHILCTGQPGDLAESIGKSGVPIEALNMPNPFSLGVCRGVKRTCLNWEIDIVHSFLSGGDAAIVRGARSSGAIGIVTSRRRMAAPPGGWFERKMQTLANDRVDRVFCNSNAVREVCRREEGIPESKLITVANGFPEGSIPSHPLLKTPPMERILLRSRMVEPKESLLACVADFTPEKNHFKLFDGFRNVLLDGSKARLILIGEGPMRQEVQSYLESRSLREGVILLGRRLDRLKILPECQALIHPGLGESFPNAILEAQALGIPVIASNEGGIPELVEHGVTGWLFPPEDELDMAAAMRKVLFDHEAAWGCALRAQELVRKKFTDRILVQACIGVYREILKEAVDRA